jgi:hypothetical protein
MRDIGRAEGPPQGDAEEDFVERVRKGVRSLGEHGGRSGEEPRDELRRRDQKVRAEGNDERLHAVIARRAPQHGGGMGGLELHRMRETQFVGQGAGKGCAGWHDLERCRRHCAPVTTTYIHRTRDSGISPRVAEYNNVELTNRNDVARLAMYAASMHCRAAAESPGVVRSAASVSQ